MYATIRFALKITFAAFALAAFSLTALAQPGPSVAVPAPSGKPAPSGGPPAFGPFVPTFPPMLEGIVSHEEYRKYTAFQQQISEDPVIKELNAKIAEQARELQRLRGEASAARERLISANPEIVAIRDKIMTLMHVRASGGPMPMPVPVPAKSP